jgi:2-polyprenyl-3-methyl-5-hydroxy-6-metoxy-1,4-benzoquinol methylase
LIYTEFINQSPFAVHFGSPDYYSRYKTLIKRFCSLAPAAPVDVLDIAGGQLAVLCKKLWADHACVADINVGGPLFDYMRSQEVRGVRWNLCKTEQPFVEQFDFIFFSEVLEHLPLPGHVVLERLRRALKPGGTLICSTPNFYRLRNLVYLALGNVFTIIFACQKTEVWNTSLNTAVITFNGNSRKLDLELLGRALPNAPRPN